MRKKNRKLRRLRELYPELRIKLFYARDFRALMLKYGRLELAEELSGHRRPGHPAALGRLDAGRPVRRRTRWPSSSRAAAALEPAPLVAAGRPSPPPAAERGPGRRGAEQARASA